MSKVGKAPIDIPEGTEIEIGERQVRVSKGGQDMTQDYEPGFVSFEQNDGQLLVRRQGEGKEYRQRHGLYRSLVANMVEGLNEPFEKQLEIQGLGYRARTQGNKLILELGFSHPIEYDLPENIEAEVEDQTDITIKGADKQLVGQVAANIKSFRPPEPYKGKGVRYKGEQIIRKEGKLSGGEEGSIS